MTDRPPKVLYITGWLRSGSTLLGNVLNELPGVLHVGELHYLWQNGILNAGTNSTCGCGEDLSACPLWSTVTDVGEAAETSGRQMAIWQNSLLRTRHTRRRLAESRGRAAPPPGVVQAMDRTAALYRALAERGGERLVIDGSKYPAEAAALLGRPDVDVRVLHVIRDPRPTAYSYRRSKQYIDPMSPARSSGYWNAFNVASELVGAAAAGRYRRVRHEDLCRDPRAVIAELLRFVGLPDEPPVDGTGHVDLGTNHTVTGNPDRFERKTVAIRPDERWRTGLSPQDIALTTAMTAPLLRRYRYPTLPFGR